MSKKLIARYLGFYLQDFIKNTSILSTIKFLQKSQNWDNKQIDNYQLKKLQQIIRHSYIHVPYYKELFDIHGISPDDIKTIEDIKKIPILTKEIARANQSKLIADNVNSKYLKKGKTGGTTGVPIVVYKDTNDRSFTWASYYRWFKWMGIEKEDKVLTFWGAKTVLSTPLKTKLLVKFIDWVQNSKTINTFEINESTLPGIYEQIIKFNPVLIKGYLSSLILVAKYMQKNNLPPNPALKALSSTTETLLPLYRNLLQDVFSVPVYDQYGCGEVSAIAYECSLHQYLHINVEHVFVESIDENNSDITDKKGRLIVTSLDNYAMPFIRYENGDMGTIHSAKCSCGINSQVMSSIDGRTTDTITLNDGSKVHGVFFTDILYEIGITTEMICRFQVYQYLSGAIDLKLETSNKISESLLQKLESEISRFVSPVKIVLVSNIANEDNGKFKYIKTEIKG
jgi:phenylacetate-CoA ligase